MVISTENPIPSCKVYLNGESLQHVMFADDKHGVVHVLDHTASRDAWGTRPPVIEHRGDVQIVPPPRGHYLRRLLEWLRRSEEAETWLAH